MVTKVQRWGNSLAVRIPKPFADDLGLAEDFPVDITVADGVLRLAPVKPQTPKLRDLLAAISDENLHDEVDWGPAVGDEVW